MNTIEIKSQSDLDIFLTPYAPAIEVEDIIVHKPFDYGTVYNYVKHTYPSIELIPISAGTELYMTFGDRASYVKNT